MRDDVTSHIICRDLFKIYKRADLEVVALRGLDMEVATGEMVAILGSSGSGKSTLLNILAGLDTPSAGHIKVANRDLLNISDAGLVMYRRLDVGFVWQVPSRNLVPYLSAVENVALPMAIAGVQEQERRSRAIELLNAFGLADKLDRQPHQLSGGEQQRVAIALAIANAPPLILADEPTGELDTESAAEVFALLESLNQQLGVTVVIVTHDVSVVDYVNRVINIRDGKISSETVVINSGREKSERRVENYLVVDKAGRLQLPADVIHRFGVGSRVRLGNQDGYLTIKSEGYSDSDETDE